MKIVNTVIKLNVTLLVLLKHWCALNVRETAGQNLQQASENTQLFRIEIPFELKLLSNKPFVRQKVSDIINYVKQQITHSVIASYLSTVSYTHLDVYKRQVNERESRLGGLHKYKMFYVNWYLYFNIMVLIINK